MWCALLTVDLVTIMRSTNMASYVPQHKLGVILPIASRTTSGTGIQSLTVHVLRADAETVALEEQVTLAQLVARP
jgi:hypothetical protein